MSIYYDSTQIGDVRAESISSVRGLGASQLRFSVSWSMHPKRDDTFSVFGSFLRISAGAEGNPDTYFIGHAFPEVAWVDESRPGIPVERRLLYLLNLQSNQLLALEEMRGHRGVHFKIEVRAYSHGPSGLRSVSESLELLVPLSQWISVLKQAGGEDILLVGAAIPLENEHPEIRSAVKLVRGAYEFLQKGDGNAAVAECRRALESFWKTANLETSASDARRALASAMELRKAMSKRQRLLALGEAVRNFTHSAHHVQQDGFAEEFSRADAALAVAVTAALLSAFRDNDS